MSVSAVARERMADPAMWGDVLLWVDVETTGLDPRHGVLLEIAIQPTAFDRELTALDEPFQQTIYHGRDLNLSDVSPKVLAMHARSGLWEESRGSGELSSCVGRLRNRLDEWPLADAVSVTLAGRSVHFDRKWLEAKLPADLLLRMCLSHRHFDLTAIKAFATLARIPVPVEEEEHRALADVNADIRLARRLIALAQPQGNP